MRTKVNENLFKDQPFYVGIDSHKKSWKVTILSDTYEHKTMSQDPVPEVLASYLKRNFPGGNYHAVYESGFNGFSSCRKLNELGVQCIVVHAADVPTTQKEKEQKTDKADSRKLARSLRGNDFEAIDVPDPKLEADRAMVRQRFSIVKDHGRIKHRITSLLFQFGINIPDHFTKAQTRGLSGTYLKWLEELPIEIKSLKQTLDNYISISKTQKGDILKLTRQVRELSQTEDYKSNYQLLLSIPGIGAIVSMHFLTQLGDVKRFPRIDELCNYIGLVPSMHGSGDKMQTGKMIRRGRKELKIMLIEAAWDAIRLDPAMMATFNILVKRMKKNKAIIRIARKLLSRIRYVLVNQKPYELSVVE